MKAGIAPNSSAGRVVSVAGLVAGPVQISFRTVWARQQIRRNSGRKVQCAMTRAFEMRVDSLGFGDHLIDVLRNGRFGGLGREQRIVFRCFGHDVSSGFGAEESKSRRQNACGDVHIAAQKIRGAERARKMFALISNTRQRVEADGGKSCRPHDNDRHELGSYNMRADKFLYRGFVVALGLLSLRGRSRGTEDSHSVIQGALP